MKKKYHIKINPPEPSSEQIRQHQDFDALLASFEKAPHPAKADRSGTLTWRIVPLNPEKRRRLKYAASAILTVVAASLLFVVLREPLQDVQLHQSPILQIQELAVLRSPLPKLAKPVETRRVQAETGETITYASGSKVTIPAAAFVDKEGAPVKGAVDITYREFNDPVDMFLAGVPKELNRHQDLQSTGMMEIKGFQNGEPIYLNLDKKLNIELQGKMAATTKAKDLGVYVYSQLKDAWRYQDKDQVEILANNKATSNDTALVPVLAALQKERRASKPTAPIRLGVPPNMQVFDFDIDLANAPELQQYSQKVDFMAAVEDLPPTTFDTVWTDMKLTKEVNKGYVLTLEYEDKQGKVLRAFAVEPVVVATDAAKARYKEEQARYQKALVAWEIDLVAEAKAQLAVGKQWVNIINRFDIDRFGLWSCGQPIQWKQTTTQSTQFVDLKGAPIAVQEVFVAAEQQQFYYSAPSANNHSELPLPQEEQWKQKIWALSAEGDLLVAQMPTDAGTNRTVLSMRPVAIPASAADFRALLTL